jgi:uncharacterized membrane protein YidH (DUF202 family)
MTGPGSYGAPAFVRLVTICVLILCLGVVRSITLFTSPGRRKAMTQAMYLVIGAIVIIVVFFVIVTLL